MKQKLSTGSQIFLLLAFVFAAFAFIQPLLTLLAFSLMDVELKEDMDLNSPLIGYTMVCCGMISLFLGGFVVWLRFTGEKWRDLLHLKGISLRNLGISLGLLVVGWFVAEALAYFNSYLIEQVPRTGWIQARAEMEAQLRTWFNAEYPQNFLPALLIFAVLPAFVEELVFRGGLMKKLIIVSHGKLHFGVVVSSLIFAAVHMQPWNLLPMIALGMILGYVYHFTKDIRLSMLLHFLYNGIQITLLFFAPGLVE